MSTAIDKLRRILVLEREQSCRDRAVIGGLERFLTFWQKEAREQEDQVSTELSVTDILSRLAGYADLSSEERRPLVEELVASLARARTLEEPAAPAPETQTSARGAPTPVETVLPPPHTDIRPQAEPPTQPTAQPSLQRERPSRGRGRAAAAPRPRPANQLPLDLHATVTTLKGIGEAGARRLTPLNIATVRDLLYHFPHRYDDYAQLAHINQLELGQKVTVAGIVVRTHAGQSRNKMAVFSAVLSDSTGQIEITWYNQPYLGQQIRKGAALIISGQVDQYLGRLVFRAPEWELARQELLSTGRIVPVYPLTEGVSQRWLRRIIKRTVDDIAPRLVDPLPDETIRSANLVPLGVAISQIHFPGSQEMLQRARQRLAFDEFLFLQLGVMGRRQRLEALPGRALEVPQERLDRFVASLPFALTAAQQQATASILADMQRPAPMSRLLQGDVGSGKTVVAVAALLVTAYNGLQAALMAPTSILAEQHMRTLERLLAPFPEISLRLLVGSMPEAEKQRVRDEIAAGRVQVVVGTHALIQESVQFHKLGLVIVDEQHRFGVEQRAELLERGDVSPHMLVMSATPIPRTLALTIYGDLDLSILDELPPGRQEIATAVRSDISRERIYSFIRGQIEQGRQAFVICPLVEDSDVIEARSAMAEAERLQKEVFPQLRVGLMHGRLGADDKDAVMAAFAAGEIDILVSTSVVEVGIDVPNASVILIESADRFGLAQLHQFRGRVGRGEHRSYCILMAEDASEASMERLAAMEATNDGFVLAEKDLQLRGPGDFFGVRQSGLPQLRVADLGDAATLDAARQEAVRLVARDPRLEKSEHALLASAVQHFWSGLNPT